MPHFKTKTLLQDCRTKILNIIPRFLLALLDHMTCDYFDSVTSDGVVIDNGIDMIY